MEDGPDDFTITGHSPPRTTTPTLAPVGDEAVSRPQPRGEKSGLFSATRWISHLPGLGGLFSPNRQAFPATTTSPPEMEGEASGRKRKTPTFGRSYSEPQLASSSSKRPRVSETIYIVDSDEEDPLLLSPESARQRRAEEVRVRQELDRARDRE